MESSKGRVYGCRGTDIGIACRQTLGWKSNPGAAGGEASREWHVVWTWRGVD
jgi:hypothetical protein